MGTHFEYSRPWQSRSDAAYLGPGLNPVITGVAVVIGKPRKGGA